MKCPRCGCPINRKTIARSLGKLSSERKAQASRENGKLGGRPRKNKKHVS